MKLQLASGAAIESFVPSGGGNWLVRVLERRDGKEVHTLYEFDPATGQPLREIVPDGLRTSAIACASGGKLFGVGKVFANHGDEGRWALLSASQQ